MPDTSASDSGPDFSTFAGGSGAAGGIIGTNLLQKSIDEFTRAVDKLDKLVNAMPGSGMLGNLQTVGPTSQVGGGSGATGGFPTIYNPFAGPAGGFPTLNAQAAGQYPTGPSSPYQGQTPQYSTWNNLPNAGYPMMGGQWAAISQQSQTMMNQMASGGNAGGSTPPPFSPRPSTGSPPPPQQPSMTFGQRAKMVAGGLAGLGGLAAGIGSQTMGSQIALNSLQYQASLMSTGGGNLTQFNKAQASAAAGTFGTAGTASAINTFGFNPQDVFQAYGIASSQSGYTPAALNNTNPNQIFGQRAFGAQILGATRAASYLNPSMSATQAAQLSGQMYSPQASLSARMMGLPAFRPMGRPGAFGMGRNMSSLFGALGASPSAAARGQWNPHWLQAQLAPGGILNQELAKGYNLNQNQISSFGNEMQVYNRLFQGYSQGGGAGTNKRLSPMQAQQLITNATSRNENTRRSAQQRLQTYGVPKNDLDRLKTLAGTQSAKVGDTSRGFTAGLDAATSTLYEFRKAMQKMINTLHLNNAEGFAQGFGGTMHQFGNLGIAGAGGGLLALIAKGLLGKSLASAGKGLLGKLLGKGGAGASGDAAAGEGAAAGDAGAGLAAGGAAAGGGAIVGWMAGNKQQQLLHHITGGHGRTGSILGDIGGLANPTQISHWGSDVGNLFGSLFGSNTQGGGSAVAGMTAIPQGSIAQGMTQTPAGPVLGINMGGKNSLSGAGVPKSAMVAVRAAESQVGTPYQTGGENPKKGFDCGGLTQWSYRQAGVAIPHTAKDQWRMLQRRSVPMNEVEEGDLVFGVGTQGDVEHVGLMVSKNRVIQAPGVGKQVQVGLFRRAQWQHAARPAGRFGQGTPSRNAGQGAASKNPHAGGAGKSNGSGNNKSNNGGGNGPYVNPIPGGVTPERIDQGADFSGSGPIKAIGSGVITETNGGGWPGGPYMAYRLTDGPAAGKFVYVAENIRPTVHVGEHVSAGQTIAMMFNGGTGIETGWAAPGGGRPLSQTAGAGGISGGNLPGGGSDPTRVGLNFDELLVRLGAKRAPNFGGRPGGKMPPGFPDWMKLKNLSGSASGGNGGTLSGSVQGLGLVNTLFPGGGRGMFGGGDLGAGDATGEGSTAELSAYQAAISGSISAGSGYFATQSPGVGLGMTSLPISGTTGGGGKGGPGGPGGFSGSGGHAIFSYLMNNIFNGDKIAAAGALASMWGESTWNPESQGTGGAGIMGWTPPGRWGVHITGNAARDMAQQLPIIKKFIAASGDWGVIRQMMHSTSILQAANLWGHGVERFGINDVHPAGIAAARKIAGLHTGGKAPAGSFALVGERGPELVRFNQQADVMDSAKTQRLLKAQVAQAPHMSGPTQAWAVSQMNTVFAGTPKQAGTGNAVTYNFGPNSICITMPASSQSLNTGANARALARQFMEAVDKEARHAGIAAGANA